MVLFLPFWLFLWWTLGYLYSLRHVSSELRNHALDAQTAELYCTLAACAVTAVTFAVRINLAEQEKGHRVFRRVGTHCAG